MNILFKTPLAIASLVSFLTMAGCNDLANKNDSDNSEIEKLPVSETTFDSKTMQISQIQADITSPSTTGYQLPSVHSNLKTYKLDDEALKNLNETLEIVNDNTEIENTAAVRAPLVYAPTYTPGCTELQINQAYGYRPNQGAQSCFYFDIPNDARAEFFALQQTSSRQVTILANHDIGANYSLSYVGETTDTDADDNLRFWAEAGHYYMFLNDAVSDNGLILIGAAINEVTYHQESNGNTPSYVGNDTPGSATIIQNGFAPLLQGTLDSQIDIDHYRMHSFWGQDLAFQVYAGTNGVGESEDLALDAFLNGQWLELPHKGELHVLSGLSANAEVLIRVRMKPGVPNGHIRYVLVAGSKPAAIQNLTPDGDVGPKVPPSHSPWARVQNEDVFSWSAKITDTTGNPVRGLYMALHAENNSWTGLVSFDYGIDTDYLGVVTSSDNVNDCDGYMEYSYLNTRYNVGAYKIYAPFFDKFGLAIINDTFLQICDDY